MFIHPEGVWYGSLNPELAREIVVKHLIGDTLIAEHVIFPEIINS
jgi:(2Fe-2S) ferredoxin